MTTEPINMSRPHLPALRKNLSFGGGRPVAKLHSAGRYFSLAIVIASPTRAKVRGGHPLAGICRR